MTPVNLARIKLISWVALGILRCAGELILIALCFSLYCCATAERATVDTYWLVSGDVLDLVVVRVGRVSSDRETSSQTPQPAPIRFDELSPRSRLIISGWILALGALWL